MAGLEDMHGIIQSSWREDELTDGLSLGAEKNARTDDGSL
jgi:hypothetical protein